MTMVRPAIFLLGSLLLADSAAAQQPAPPSIAPPPPTLDMSAEKAKMDNLAAEQRAVHVDKMIGRQQKMAAKKDEGTAKPQDALTAEEGRALFTLGGLVLKKQEADQALQSFTQNPVVQSASQKMSPK